MSVRKLFGTKTLGGTVFWVDKYEFQGWRIQYNSTFDAATPLKPYRLLDPENRLMASADSVDELVQALPRFLDRFDGKFPAEYSDERFWTHVKSYARNFAEDKLFNIFLAYYTLTSEDVPGWAKTTLVGALGYLVFPIDFIPDILPPPPIGFVDDFAVIAAALVSVVAQITPEIERKAREQARLLIG